jgi:4-hydroxy-4-methyl-2-oxoglutarate aldolase
LTFGSINEPICISGVTVCAGDAILADESGVVCVPHGRLTDVIELADRILEQEALLEAQVIDGNVSSWDAI